MRCFIFLIMSLSVCGHALSATLVHNIHGYTMDHGKRVSFVAMEYDEGRVTQLYENVSDVSQSKASERIDGRGATLLPGLIDAHGHIPGLGQALSVADLVGSESEAVAVARIRDFILEFPHEKWVMGRGWNQVLWSVKEFPNRQSLDAAVHDKPAVLERVDGHAVWVNSKALSLAGISNDTPNPVGGEIIRDEEGVATGVLIDNAMDMVKRLIPAATDDQTQAYEVRALHYLASLGMTSAHDAGVSAPELKAYQALLRNGKLPIRVYPMLWVLDPRNDDTLNGGPLIDSNHMLDVRSVKVQSDGALGSRGAALFKDYSDSEGNRGLMLLTDKELEHHISRAMAAGYQVNTHAIGDLANARVLDIYEAFIKRTDSRELRHRIEHAQILRVADISRFADLGVIASVQPTHATSDKNMAGDRLGEERMKGAYAWKTLLDSGAFLAGGSDFPVEPPNPFFGLHAAVTRQDRNNQPLGGWMKSEKLSREVSLSLFTEGAAYAAHQDEFIGRLLPGYYADFILVRDNYFTIPAEDIWKNKVIATYVAGKEVFRAEDN